MQCNLVFLILWSKMLRRKLSKRPTITSQVCKFSFRAAGKLTLKQKVHLNLYRFFFSRLLLYFATTQIEEETAQVCDGWSTGTFSHQKLLIVSVKHGGGRLMIETSVGTDPKCPAFSCQLTVKVLLKSFVSKHETICFCSCLVKKEGMPSP